MMIVIGLNRNLPERYVAEPQIHLGSSIEVDVATYEEGEPIPLPPRAKGNGGGTATATWSPSRPTLAVATDLPNMDEYEVRVYDTRSGTPARGRDRDRQPCQQGSTRNRRAFVAEMRRLDPESRLRRDRGSCHDRTSDLYGDLLELLGQTDPSLADEPSPLYAVSCRWARTGDAWQLEAWRYPLTLGRPLPTLPLWLAENLAVPLELDLTYEETCRILRIP